MKYSLRIARKMYDGEAFIIRKAASKSLKKVVIDLANGKTKNKTIFS